MSFLIYASTATRSFSQDDLLALLEQARKTNARLGLTGLLLYAPGNEGERGTFVQMLEGNAPVLAQMYAKILDDQRHRDCTILKQGSWYQRRFTDWSMGFRDISTLRVEDLRGFNPIFLRNWTLPQVLKEPDPVIQLLYSFSAV